MLTGRHRRWLYRTQAEKRGELRFVGESTQGTPSSLSYGTRGRGSLAAAVAALLVLSGCAVPRGDPAPPALPDGVSVTLVQLRSDVAARQVQVAVHNDSDEAIEVGSVVVTDPRFAGVAERVVERTSVVSPGRTVDIRIQLPSMACDATDGGSTVQLVLLERGADDRREAPLPDPLDVLGPMHERECRAEALADSAAVSFSTFTASPPGAAADLVLEIVPTGNGTARIGGIQTTNLLTFEQGPGASVDTYPIDVDITVGDAATTTVHLPLVPLRCDPHAVMEDKRGTIFTLEVEVEGVPGQIELAAPDELKGRLLSWVGDWCEFGAQ